MKAVLVLDMPDGISLDGWYAVTVVVDKMLVTEEELIHGIPFDKSKIFEFVPLRPLPEKDEEPEDDMTDFVQKDYDRMASYFYGLINGRNGVINEILGEYDAVD